MVYSLGIGKNERLIVEQCVRMRQPYPDAIANAPELDPGLNLFYMAFLDLTSCRTLGYSQGPIPWLAIHHYCEANGIEGEQREDVFYHVSRLDQAYIDWCNKKATPQPADTPDKKPRRRR